MENYILQVVSEKEDYYSLEYIYKTIHTLSDNLNKNYFNLLEVIEKMKLEQKIEVIEINQCTFIKVMKEYKIIKDFSQLSIGKNIVRMHSYTNRDKYYELNLQEKTCSCLSFTYRQKMCKHLKAVLS